MSKWVIRTWPKVNHSLFNKFNFKTRMWFPAGNKLPAQSLGFALQTGSTKNSAGHGTHSDQSPCHAFHGEVTTLQCAGGLRAVTGSWHAVTENQKLEPPSCTAVLLTESQDSLYLRKSSLLIINLIEFKEKYSSLVTGSVSAKRSQPILAVFDAI